MERGSRRLVSGDQSVALVEAEQPRLFGGRDDKDPVALVRGQVEFASKQVPDPLGRDLAVVFVAMALNEEVRDLPDGEPRVTLNTQRPDRLKYLRLGVEPPISNHLTVVRPGQTAQVRPCFLIGLLRVRTTGEVAQGAHEPLIPTALFERVQQLMKHKTHTKANRHQLLFRRLIRCASCKRVIRGEIQKGHTYYRCHSTICRGACLREEAIEVPILGCLERLRITKEEANFINQELHRLETSGKERVHAIEKAYSLRLAQLNDRLNRLTDFYLDQAIEKDAFEQRKETLLIERRRINEQVQALQNGDQDSLNEIREAVKLCLTGRELYRSGSPEQRRTLLQTIWSNFTLSGKQLELTMQLPFLKIAQRNEDLKCGHCRDRTCGLFNVNETLYH